MSHTTLPPSPTWNINVTGQFKCDGKCAEAIFRLSAKRKSPFKSAEASVQSTTGSRGVRISSSNAGYTMLRGSVKSTGYPLNSPVSTSLSLPCVTVCHHISTGVCLQMSVKSFALKATVGTFLLPFKLWSLVFISWPIWNKCLKEPFQTDK